MDKVSYRKQAIQRWRQKRLDRLSRLRGSGTSNVINVPHLLPIDPNNSQLSMTIWVMRCPSCKEESKVVTRTRVGIAVDDGTGSINTVIFDLDAEKLIPFTALQFWEADNEELNFSAELASAIGTHSIMCFIRYYESDYQGQKEGKYNIVKAHTTKESVHIPMAITTAETNEKIPDLHATVLQSAKKNEFFSPSTKKLLDTIVESSATANKVPPPVTTAKRALVFGTVPPEIGLNSIEAKTPTLLPTNVPGSPLKKQRDDEL